jgi:hypothetical protein
MDANQHHKHEDTKTTHFRLEMPTALHRAVKVSAAQSEQPTSMQALVLSVLAKHFLASPETDQPRAQAR